MKRPRFSDEEIEIVRSAWANDALESPLAYACERIPRRTPASIQIFASNHGWARERAARRGRAKAQRKLEHDRAKMEKKRKAAATKAADAAKAAVQEAELLAKVAGLTLSIAPPQLAPARAPAPAAVIPIRGGKCDRGDRELILKRLKNYVIPQLAGELHRTPADVEAAIATIAADGFRPEVSKFAVHEWEPEESFHARKA